jgi:hypothetical protein
MIFCRNLLIWQKNRKNGTLSKPDETHLRKKKVKLALEIKKCMAEARKVLPEKHWENIQHIMQAISKNQPVNHSDIFVTEMEWYNEQSSSDSDSDIDQDMVNDQQNQRHAHNLMKTWEEVEDGEESNDEDEDEEFEDNDNLGGEDMLFLPSLIGVARCKMFGLEEWMKDEERLQEGQANDALE